MLCVHVHSKWFLWCPTICDPMDCSPPGSSVHRILQARILEGFAMPFSKGSSQPRDRTQASHIAGRFFTTWATRKARDTSKALPEVLVWPLVNFYWLWKIENSGQYQNDPHQPSFFLSLGKGGWKSHMCDWVQQGGMGRMWLLRKWMTERKWGRGERKQEKGVSGGKNRWEEAHRVMDKKGRNRKGERDHGEKRGHLFPIYTVCYMEWEEQGVGLITAQSPEKKKRKKTDNFPFASGS